MRRMLWIVLASLLALPLLANDFVVKGVKGSVEVRRGVMEEWHQVKVRGPRPPLKPTSGA
jgi:hypothetical protein